MLDPIESTPFEIGRKSNFISLPDSISKRAKGFVALELFINSQGNMDGFNVIKFLLLVGNDSLISFFENSDRKIRSKSSYPADIQSYYPVLTNCVNEIEIKSRSGVTPKEVNRLTILARFQ
jgi:hypothetical protein